MDALVTEMDLPLMVRIVSIAQHIFHALDIPISENPVIVIPNVSTALRIIFNSDDVDCLLYSKECHDSWIEKFNKPLSENDAIAAAKVFFTRSADKWLAHKGVRELLLRKEPNFPTEDLDLFMDNYPLISNKLFSALTPLCSYRKTDHKPKGRL